MPAGPAVQARFLATAEAQAMNSRLSPERFRSYLERVELPLRSATLPESSARRILRYGGFVGSVIERHVCLERTMISARKRIQAVEQAGGSVASGTVVLADSLSGSKGRFTRSWHAPVGGLWGSLTYVSTLLPHYRLLVPLALGVACCEAVQESGCGQAAIRWVNDVLVDGLKLGGFLSQSFTGDQSGEFYCLIGFGINVNNLDFPFALQASATSLKQQTGKHVDLEAFTYCFLAKLAWNLGLLYHQEQIDLARHSGEEDPFVHPLLQRWLALSDSIGRPVVFGFDVVKKPQYRAVVEGLSPDGGLRLILEDGSVTTEYSGEIRYLG